MNHRIITRFILISILFISCASPEKERQGELVEINGAEIFIHTIGEGELILFLHGGPGLNFSYFLPWLEPLSDDYKLIFFDQRGMGKSDTQISPDQFSLELLVEDIDAIRQHFGHEKIHLIAHSWGGMLAMRYAIKYDDHLESLILSNTVPASTEFMDEIIESRMNILERADRQKVTELQARLQAGENDPAFIEQTMIYSYQPMFYDTALVHLLKLNLDENYGNTQRLLQRLPRPSNAPDLHPDLENVSVPVLIIRSEMEPMPLSSDEKLADTFQNSILESINRAGHFPFIERQDDFIDAVRQFLQSN